MQITDLGKCYSDVVVELEIALDSVNVMAKYPKVSEVKDQIRNYQIKARSLLKRLCGNPYEISEMSYD